MTSTQDKPSEVSNTCEAFQVLYGAVGRGISEEILPAIKALDRQYRRVAVGDQDSVISIGRAHQALISAASGASERIQHSIIMILANSLRIQADLARLLQDEST